MKVRATLRFVSGTTLSDDERSQRLAEAVATVLAPMVAADGGSIEWVGLEAGVAHVRMGVSCAGCPGQTYTTRNVVLAMLQTLDPDVHDVRVRPAV